jgi:hypothetical protein
MPQEHGICLLPVAFDSDDSRAQCVGEAIRYVRLWLAVDCAEIVGPGPEHAKILFGLLQATGAGANLT